MACALSFHATRRIFPLSLAGLWLLASPNLQAAPDLIIGGLNGIIKNPTEAEVTSYSIGAVTCNLGDEPAEVSFSSNHHPIVATNLYRLENGRFEQIGMSWLFNAYCALSGGTCGTCTPGATCSQLGPGCSTSDTATAVGQQVNMSPRSDVNPSTGVFLFPPSNPSFSGTLARRLQVANADLDPAAHPGAQYFAEMEIASSQDAAAGHALNNSSYRPVVVGPLSGGGFMLAFSGPTTREQPALSAWADVDPGVVITSVDVPGDGRLTLAARASRNTDGSWHYEYALLNVNSDRAADSFGIPVPPRATVTNIGFHDVAYHSGETIDGTDWSPSTGSAGLIWATQSFDVNPDANALRWGTVYNFRFDATSPPGPVSATIGLFQPGTPDSVALPTTGPTTPAPADLSGDGHVNGIDLAMLLAQWGRCPICIADPCPCSADLNGDRVVSGLDLAMLLAAWG